MSATLFEIVLDGRAIYARCPRFEESVGRKMTETLIADDWPTPAEVRQCCALASVVAIDRPRSAAEQAADLAGREQPLVIELELPDDLNVPRGRG